MATLIWLPSTLGQLVLRPLSTTRQATSTSNPTSQSREQEKEFREGRRIIEETAAVYKSCKSYQDEGEMIRVDDNSSGQRTHRMLFKTTFVRPGRFRFEYRDIDLSKPQFIVWADNRDIRTWWRNPVQEEKLDSVARGFAATWYMSGGNPSVIPAFLMPEELDVFSLTRLKNIRIVNKEQSQGALYHILEADDGPLVSMWIWIDAETKLVTKVVEHHTFPSAPSERITTYKAKINANIPAADLEFNAPKE